MWHQRTAPDSNTQLTIRHDDTNARRHSPGRVTAGNAAHRRHTDANAQRQSITRNIYPNTPTERNAYRHAHAKRNPHGNQHAHRHKHPHHHAHANATRHHPESWHDAQRAKRSRARV